MEYNKILLDDEILSIILKLKLITPQDIETKNLIQRLQQILHD